MKKKIILTETQYLKLTKFLLEDINNDFKYIKNGDILSFTLKNNQNVNLKITSVNIPNNEILAYGPKNEKIMLRIGEFNEKNDFLTYHQFDDVAKKYIPKKVYVKDMNIWRDNDLFVAPENITKPTNNQSNNNINVNQQQNNQSKNLSGLEVNNIITVKNQNDETYSITITSIEGDDVYGKDQDNFDVVIKNIDDKNKEMTIIKNDGDNQIEEIIKFEEINIEKNKNKINPDYYNDLFNKYYKEIINDPNLKKAFYKAPSFWNYFTSALNNEKARGKGIFPAYEIINGYFNKKIDEKLPGFANKENKRASFYLFDDINIRYKKINEEEFKNFTLNAGYYKATVRQYEAGLGDVKVLTYRSSGGSFGFKIIVKKPTGERPDEYFCDVYVNKNNVEENKYFVENVRIKFLDSEGYTSYEKLKKNS
jgi:hypothetical protein